MWPSWHVYEPMIRAMAGLGVLEESAPYPVAAQRHASCDLLVIGAGGLAWRRRARRVLLASGALDRPLVFPDNDRPGAREGYGSVEHLKRYTTLGMAQDQGKTANINVLSLLAAGQDKSIAEAGTTTFRPPFVPQPLVHLWCHAGGRAGMG